MKQPSLVREASIPVLLQTRLITPRIIKQKSQAGGPPHLHIPLGALRNLATYVSSPNRLELRGSWFWRQPCLIARSRRASALICK